MEWVLSKFSDAHAYFYPEEHLARSYEATIDDEFFKVSTVRHRYAQDIMDHLEDWWFNIPVQVINEHYLRWSKFMKYVNSIDPKYTSRITSSPRFQQIKSDYDNICAIKHDYDTKYAQCTDAECRITVQNLQLNKIIQLDMYDLSKPSPYHYSTTPHADSLMK